MSLLLTTIVAFITLVFISGYYQKKWAEETGLCPTCKGDGCVPGLVEHVEMCDSCDGTGKYKTEM